MTPVTPQSLPCNGFTLCCLDLNISQKNSSYHRMIMGEWTNFLHATNNVDTEKNATYPLIVLIEPYPFNSDSFTLCIAQALL